MYHSSHHCSLICHVITEKSLVMFDLIKVFRISGSSEMKCALYYFHETHTYLCPLATVLFNRPYLRHSKKKLYFSSSGWCAL